MRTKLVIHDGTPHWWQSPDIWVVPGTDPTASPGQAIAGKSAYVWARVTNEGEEPVQGARIDYFWSNPATGVLRSNSQQIGSAYVDLKPGEAKEVPCLAPWVPVLVNDGHECLVAQVIHAGDPLPNPLPDAFQPPQYHQVAQRNVNVLAMTSSAMMRKLVEVATSPREECRLKVSLEVGRALDREVLRKLGLPEYRPLDKFELRAGLSLDPGTEEHASSVALSLGPKSRVAVYLKVRPLAIPDHHYVPLDVVAHDGKKIRGGVTYLLTGKEV